MMDSLLLGINYHELFVPGIGLAEKIIRPVIVYFLLVIGLRIAGKREMAQLNTFDMVVLLTLSNTVQNAIIGNDNSLSGGIIGAATLLLLNAFMVKMLYRHRKLERFVEGEPSTLIRDGKIKTAVLQKESISMEELSEAAHKQGISSLTEVDTAVIDPDGGMNFSKKESTMEAIRHREIMKRIDTLTKTVESLKSDIVIKNKNVTKRTKIKH